MENSLNYTRVILRKIQRKIREMTRRIGAEFFLDVVALSFHEFFGKIFQKTREITHTDEKCKSDFK